MTAAGHASLVLGAEAGHAAAFGGGVGTLGVGQVGFFTLVSVVSRQPPRRQVSNVLHAGLKSPPYSHIASSFEHGAPTPGSVNGQSTAPAPTNSFGALVAGSDLLEHATIAVATSTKKRKCVMEAA